jgi:predicted AAA+ superfamily ATPase
MIPRALASELLTLVDEYPVVTILGPRQSGKTTLARATFPDCAYNGEPRMLSNDIRAFPFYQVNRVL